jgi:hypothetical protein
MVPRVGLGGVPQPQRRQRDTREADAEFLQRPAAGDRLGQAFSQFIELVIHNFPFRFVVSFVSLCFLLVQA